MHRYSEQFESSHVALIVSHFGWLEMESTCFDRLKSTLASAVDAAIERVVSQFEDDDVALRSDVLRALSVHARLGLETERFRAHMRGHPISMELFASKLAETLVVDSYSCQCDAEHQSLSMRATVRWPSALALNDAAEPATKKRRKQPNPDAKSSPLVLHYEYSCVRAGDENDDGEVAECSIVNFRVKAATQENAAAKELVHFVLACPGSYPRSYYEEPRDEDDDEDNSDDGEEPQKSDEPAASKAKKDDDDEEDKEQEEAEAPDGGEGERVETFQFDGDVLDEIVAWLQIPDETVEPGQIVAFFTALPVSEGEWQLDDRICEILFSAGGDSDSEEGDGEGGDDHSEQEEEDEAEAEDSEDE